jgi:BON domain
LAPVWVVRPEENVRRQLEQQQVRVVLTCIRDIVGIDDIDHKHLTDTKDQRSEKNGENIMAYEEQQARRSRVVVDTPTERREVVTSQSVQTPDRSGISAGMVGVLVVVAIALVTILVLFWMSSQPASDPNANLTAAQQQPPTVVQQAPAQQPPVIIQQPAPVTQPAPIVIAPPAGGSTQPSTSAPANDDMTIQMNIDKQLTDDPAFSSLGITASVINGKVTLLGTVKSDALKSQVEKMVRRVKGVKAVDNQITVIA